MHHLTSGYVHAKLLHLEVKSFSRVQLFATLWTVAHQAPLVHGIFPSPGITVKFGLGVQNEAGQKLVEFCQENTLVIANTAPVIANTVFQQHKRRLYTWTSPDGQLQNQIDYILCTKDGEALYSQQKQDEELTVAQTMNSLLPNSDLN